MELEFAEYMLMRRRILLEILWRRLYADRTWRFFHAEFQILVLRDIVNDQFSWDVSPELEIQWLLK
ncbi:hypothetical protein Csa_005286 [Cucumis sativus]|nr:hypothetical protein Csa_005286 [Cucumis sativus]